MKTGNKTEPVVVQSFQQLSELTFLLGTHG